MTAAALASATNALESGYNRSAAAKSCSASWQLPRFRCAKPGRNTAAQAFGLAATARVSTPTASWQRSAGQRPLELLVVDHPG